MTKSQIESMIKFHEKAERAFIRFGKINDAESARKKKEELKRKLEDIK